MPLGIPITSHARLRVMRSFVMGTSIQRGAGRPRPGVLVELLRTFSEAASAEFSTKTRARAPGSTLSLLRRNCVLLAFQCCVQRVPSQCRAFYAHGKFRNAGKCR